MPVGGVGGSQSLLPSPAGIGLPERAAGGEFDFSNPDALPPVPDAPEAGAEIGARNALVVSSDPDIEATKRRFAEICRIAERCGLDACFEFLPITEVKSLEGALEVIRAVGHPRARLLVDALHLRRSGGDPAQLAGLPASLFSYAQICDAPSALNPMNYETLLHEAIDGRLMPGDGELPLGQLLDALPAELPLAPEQRSRALRERYPDATERATAILGATRRFMADYEAARRT